MIAEPLARRSVPHMTAAFGVENPRTPDSAFNAIPRLTRLRDALAAPLPAAKTSRWREPPVFFFDPRRQADLAAARTQPEQRVGALDELVAAEISALCGSVDVRRVARTIPGLRETAHQRGYSALVELLDIPDDEIVLVLHPELRVGFRFSVRGVADVAQFHVLMVHAAGDLLPGPALPSRFYAACFSAKPVVPAGVPMIVDSRFQFHLPSALQPDGTLPTSFRACHHWLWGTQPLAAVPRRDGERLVLIGPPAFQQTWEVERRFPTMAAEATLLEVLSPFRTLELLSRCAGQPIVSRTAVSDLPVLARAA